MTPEERRLHDEVFDLARGRAVAVLLVVMIAAAFWLDGLHLWDSETSKLIGAGLSLPACLVIWWAADRIALWKARVAVGKVRRKH